MNTQADVFPTNKVGVWKETEIDGARYYVRDHEMRKEWHFWASHGKIPPKGRCKRVVLLGESVARGYFYDPHYTPAMVLEEMLNRDKEEIEVIDMARVSITLSDLTNLTMECSRLEPEALVIFAGNNWHVTLLKFMNEQDFALLDDIRTNEGVAGLWREINNRLRSLTIDYIRCLQSLYVDKGIPVIFIIPEFNLLDWKSNEQEQIVSILKEGDLEQWVKFVHEAEDSWEQADFEKAEAAGQRLIMLDFSHPLGYEIVAACHLKQARNEAARSYLERARDTSILPRSNSSQARTFSVVADTMLEMSERAGIQIIDSRQLLKSHGRGDLPGRKLFLDYCHLTSEGIQITMYEAAQRLSTIFCRKPPAPSIAVSEEVEAKAYFCAAVHNAHYGQGYEILHYLCLSALNKSMSVKSLMIRYADFATRKLSNILCKTHESVVADEEILQYEQGTGFLHQKHSKIMDLDLVDAIMDTLATKGVDIRDDIGELRNTEHGLDHGPVDLLKSYYSQTSYNKFPGKELLYFQARNFRSNFIFISEKSRDVRLWIIYRTPRRGPDAGSVTISVNGKEVASVQSSKSWIYGEVSVPASFVRSGANKITITWPFRTQDGDSEKPGPTSKTGAHFLHHLYEIFGEIHMFHILKGDAACGNTPGKGCGRHAACTGRNCHNV